MAKSDIIIRERVYIPIHLVNVPELKEAYTTMLYEDRACKVCEYLPDRHSYICDTCPAYKGKVKLFNLKDRNNKKYIGLPIGDKKNFERKTGLLLEEQTFKDLRQFAPFDYKIQFLATLRDYQIPVVEKFLEKKNRFGMIEAPPRSGKTLMMLYIALRLGQRVILLANQHEFLTQFLDHIHGNENKSIPKCTNLPELEKKYGKKLYGIPKTDEDFENFQFFTMTYQGFLSEKNGLNRFKKITKNVGTLMVDEVHKAGADGFARVVNLFPCRYKFGVTGTIERKDGRQFIYKAILGPVVSKSTREALTPTVILHKTEAHPKRKYSGGPGAWVQAMQFLAKDKKRNALIVDWVMKDLAKGHSIVIPVTFKAHASGLVADINKAWREKTGKDKIICEIFTGGGGKANKERREKVLDQINENKIRVLVGIRSLLQLGLNVPRWSAIYECSPISNEPNLKQETRRICTPLEGKRSPIIRLFVDMELGQSLGCARNSIKHMKGFKYDFMKSDKQRALIYDILGASYQRERNSDANSDDAQFVPTKSLFKDTPVARVPVKRL